MSLELQAASLDGNYWIHGEQLLPSDIKLRITNKSENVKNGRVVCMYRRKNKKSYWKVGSGIFTDLEDTAVIYFNNRPNIGEVLFKVLDVTGDTVAEKKYAVCQQFFD